MVSLRDGKTYDPSSDSVSSGSSRRRSTASAPASAQRQSTRRSSRLASTSADGEDSIPYQQEEPVTPARGKRQRPQQLAVVAEPAAAAADADDLLDASDVANTDQGMQIHGAAAMDLPEDSPSAPPSAKKPRIPAACHAPNPSKAAGAASKLRREAMSVSIAAAVMVLVAAVAMAALLPGLQPHRDSLRVSVLQAAAHTDAAYVQPLKARAIDGFDTAKLQLAAASAAAQQQAQAALLQACAHLNKAQQRWPEYAPAWLLEKLGRASQPSTTGAWSIDVLTSVMPAGTQWAEYAADVAEKLQAPPAQRDNKAPALLLACGSDDDCDEAAAALAVLPPKGEACALTINSRDLASTQPAAALQATLAPFLQRCPAGLVVLRGAQDLPVGAAPALLNALSELGGFQHGGKVEAFRAAYALLLQLHPARVADAARAQDTAVAAAGLKDAFFSTLESQLSSAAASAPAAEEAHWAGVQRAVSPLRRRIEFAAPVRLGASTEAALDAAAAPAPAGTAA